MCAVLCPLSQVPHSQGQSQGYPGQTRHWRQEPGQPWGLKAGVIGGLRGQLQVGSETQSCVLKLCSHGLIFSAITQLGINLFSLF
jgi:hypothetical protein